VVIGAAAAVPFGHCNWNVPPKLIWCWLLAELPPAADPGGSGI
jgi:hypothetical protein